jgi:hypothetical protein
MQERHGLEIEPPRLIEANPRRSPAVAGPELVEIAPERSHPPADPQRSPWR